MPEQNVAYPRQDVSSALVALGYVAAVILMLPVLLIGRVDRELLLLVIGVTFVAFTIAGRKLQEHGSDGLTRLGAFLWLLTPPLIGVWTTGYTSIFRPLVSTIEPLAPPLVWALLAAYFHDRRPSAIQHLWCFGGVFVIIVVLTPPTGSVTAWASPSLVALGVTWLVQTLRQRLRPAWLGYALGGCALALGLFMLLAEMVTVPTGR